MTPKPTGWDNHLCQDISKPLHKWFASRMDARHTLRQVFSKYTPHTPNQTNRNTP